MSEEKFLIRMDGHLARIDEHMARGNEHMARGNELMDENRQAFQDLRTTLREINLRSEKFMRAVIAQLEENREEMRDQRSGLWAVIDELRGGGPSTA
jgi:Spy/CpxP family protein refolding chaperone